MVSQCTMKPEFCRIKWKVSLSNHLNCLLELFLMKYTLGIDENMCKQDCLNYSERFRSEKKGSKVLSLKASNFSMHAFLLTSRYFITTSCIERQGAPTFPIFLSAKVLLQYDDFFFPRKLKWCYSEQRILRNFSTSKFPSCLPCIVKL